mgnify:CR=1 FL=1|jgi:phage head morphogenesis protein, SPP1 gp7 family
MFQKAISNLEKQLVKIYKKSKKDEITLGIARKYGLENAISKFEKELHKAVRKEEKSFTSNLQHSYLDGYMAETGAKRRPLKKAKETIKYPWSGMNYQQRLGKNYMEMTYQMRKAIESALKSDGSLSEILAQIKQIEHKFQYRHNLLVRTEIRHMHYQGEYDAHLKNGVKFLQYVTVGDHRVCPECRALEEYNEGIYPIEEAPTLPRHPHCRCKEVPYEK